MIQLSSAACLQCFESPDTSQECSMKAPHSTNVSHDSIAGMVSSNVSEGVGNASLVGRGPKGSE